MIGAGVTTSFSKINGFCESSGAPKLISLSSSQLEMELSTRKLSELMTGFFHSRLFFELTVLDPPDELPLSPSENSPLSESDLSGVY